MIAISEFSARKRFEFLFLTVKPYFEGCFWETSKSANVFFCFAYLKRYCRIPTIFEEKAGRSLRTHRRLTRWHRVKYRMSCCHERVLDGSSVMNGSSVYRV